MNASRRPSKTMQPHAAEHTVLPPALSGRPCLSLSPAKGTRPGRGAAGRFAVLLTALLLAALPARAQNGDDPLAPKDDFNKGGRTAFQFLKIGLGARQTALGEAGIASVRDVNAMFWNPAGISGIASTEVSFSYNRWLADMNYVAGAVGMRWKGVGVFALGVAALDYGDIPEAIVPPEGSTDSGLTGNTFSGGDFMAGLAFSREFTDRLSIGLGVKFLRESLFDYAVNSYAFDVGTNFDMGYKGLRLAMSVQNYGGSVRYLDETVSDRTYDLPLLFRIGLSTSVVGAGNAFVDMGPAHQLTFSVEAINTNDYSERLHFGAEYAFNDFITLRGGYRLNYEEGNFSAGVGLAPRLPGMEMRVDYAYVAYEFLDAPHRFTVSLAF